MFNIHLSNHTKANLTFTVNDEKITIPFASSHTVPVEKCNRVWVNGENLQGDFWHYEINEDIWLKCHLYGDELKLHL